MEKPTEASEGLTEAKDPSEFTYRSSKTIRGVDSVKLQVKMCPNCLNKLKLCDKGERLLVAQCNHLSKGKARNSVKSLKHFSGQSLEKSEKSATEQSTMKDITEDITYHTPHHHHIVPATDPWYWSNNIHETTQVLYDKAMETSGKTIFYPKRSSNQSKPYYIVPVINETRTKGGDDNPEVKSAVWDSLYTPLRQTQPAPEPDEDSISEALRVSMSPIEDDTFSMHDHQEIASNFVVRTIDNMESRAQSAAYEERTLAQQFSRDTTGEGPDALPYLENTLEEMEDWKMVWDQKPSYTQDRTRAIQSDFDRQFRLAKEEIKTLERKTEQKFHQVKKETEKVAESHVTAEQIEDAFFTEMPPIETDEHTPPRTRGGRDDTFTINIDSICLEPCLDVAPKDPLQVEVALVPKSSQNTFQGVIIPENPNTAEYVLLYGPAHEHCVQNTKIEPKVPYLSTKVKCPTGHHKLKLLLAGDSNVGEGLVEVKANGAYKSVIWPVDYIVDNPEEFSVSKVVQVPVNVADVALRTHGGDEKSRFCYDCHSQINMPVEYGGTIMHTSEPWSNSGWQPAVMEDYGRDVHTVTQLHPSVNLNGRVSHPIGTWSPGSPRSPSVVYPVENWQPVPDMVSRSIHTMGNQTPMVPMVSRDYGSYAQVTPLQDAPMYQNYSIGNMQPPFGGNFQPTHTVPSYPPVYSYTQQPYSHNAIGQQHYSQGLPLDGTGNTWVQVLQRKDEIRKHDNANKNQDVLYDDHGNVKYSAAYTKLSYYSAEKAAELSAAVSATENSVMESKDFQELKAHAQPEGHEVEIIKAPGATKIEAESVSETSTASKKSNRKLMSALKLGLQKIGLTSKEQPKPPKPVANTHLGPPIPKQISYVPKQKEMDYTLYEEQGQVQPMQVIPMNNSYTGLPQRQYSRISVPLSEPSFHQRVPSYSPAVPASTQFNPDYPHLSLPPNWAHDQADFYELRKTNQALLGLEDSHLAPKHLPNLGKQLMKPRLAKINQFRIPGHSIMPTFLVPCEHVSTWEETDCQSCTDSDATCHTSGESTQTGSTTDSISRLTGGELGQDEEVKKASSTCDTTEDKLQVHPGISLKAIEADSTT